MNSNMQHTQKSGPDGVDYCGSEGEVSEDSDNRKLLEVLNGRSRQQKLLPSNSSTTIDDGSVSPPSSSVKKRRIEKNGAIEMDRANNEDPITPSKEKHGAGRKPPNMEEDVKHDSSDDSDFEDLASFWNSADGDFLKTSYVEGIVLDDAPPGDPCNLAQRTGLTTEGGPPSSSVTADARPQNQRKQCFKNPYKPGRPKALLGEKQQMEQTAIATGDASRPKNVQVAELNCNISMPKQTPSSSQIDQSAEEEGKSDEWLERLLEEQLAEVEKDIGTSQIVHPLETPTWPKELNEDNIAEAFGFSEVTQTANHQSSKSCISQGRELWDDGVHQNTMFPPGIELEDRKSEVHPELFAPRPPPPVTEPLVHLFTEATSPRSERQRLPVRQVFDQHQVIASFFKHETFNHLQSVVANTCAFSDDNMVLSAPTGAGKTVVFEMAMARFFTVDMQRNNGKVSNHRKLMYVAPNKALCEQRVEDWSARLAHLQIQVAAITGDGDPGEAFRDIATSHVLVTTPEKWDSVTRKWTENFYLLASVKLVLLDEIHLIADPTRGACLEAILCRLKAIQRASQSVEASLETIHSSR